MNKCLGCGIAIQNNKPEELGYSPKKDAKYCERCFRVKHYSEAKLVSLPKEQKEIIKEINKKASFVLFIVDVLNITNEVINTYKEINVPKVLVVNKADIFPKSLRHETVEQFLRDYYFVNDKIIFVSALKGYGLREIKNLIENNNYTYLVGFTNSGKSSLINTLKKEYKTTENLTTSIIPNTTIDFIKTKLDNNTIIDSPGFIYDSSIFNDKDLNLIKKTNIKNSIHPVTYQIKENDKVLIEDIIRIDSSCVNSYTFYMSNNLHIKKIYKDILNDLDYKTYEIGTNKDLIVKGLGFINIKKPTTLTIYSKDLKLIEIRDSMIGK